MANRTFYGVVLLSLASAALGALAAHQATQPETVHRTTLPLQFPVVGNVDAVKQWRFGRLERVDDIAGEPNVMLFIRIADGTVLQMRGPSAPLDDLARQSDWLTSPGRQSPGRTDYVERMVAFDVDANGVLIAAASLEPINRNRSRLRRVLGSS
jgi:hypothetical protein